MLPDLRPLIQGFESWLVGLVVAGAVVAWVWYIGGQIVSGDHDYRQIAFATIGIIVLLFLIANRASVLSIAGL
jgi:hypothetical protein